MVRRIVFVLGMTTCLGNSDLADARLNPFIFEDVPHLSLKSLRTVKGISRNEKFFSHSSKKPKIIREKKSVLFTRRTQPKIMTQQTYRAQRISSLKQEIETRKRLALKAVTYRRGVAYAQPTSRQIRKPLHEIQRRRNLAQPLVRQNKRLSNLQPALTLNNHTRRIQPYLFQIKRYDILANRRTLSVRKPPQVSHRRTPSGVIQPISFREFLKRGILNKKRIKLSTKQSKQDMGSPIYFGQSLSLKEMLKIANKPLLSTAQKSPLTHQSVPTETFRNPSPVTISFPSATFSVKNLETQDKHKENSISKLETTVKITPAVSSSEDYSPSFVSSLIRVQEAQKNPSSAQDFRTEEKIALLNSEPIVIAAMGEPSQSLKAKTESLQSSASSGAVSQGASKVPAIPMTEAPVLTPLVLLSSSQNAPMRREMEPVNSPVMNPLSSLDPLIFAHVSSLQGRVSQAQGDVAQTLAPPQPQRRPANNSLLPNLQRRRQISLTPLSLSRSLSQPQVLTQRGRGDGFSDQLSTEERRNDSSSILLPILPAQAISASVENESDSQKNKPLHLVLRLRGAEAAVNPSGSSLELNTDSDPVLDTSDKATTQSPQVAPSAAATLDMSYVLLDTNFVLVNNNSSNSSLSAAEGSDSTVSTEDIVEEEVEGKSKASLSSGPELLHLLIQQGNDQRAQNTSAVAPDLNLPSVLGSEQVQSTAASAVPQAAAHQQAQPQSQGSAEDENEDFIQVNAADADDEPGAPAVALNPSYLQQVLSSINPLNWLAS